MTGPATGGPRPPAAGFPEQVVQALRRCTFSPGGPPVVCAVSGGADSLALMALAVAAGCAVRAVHVDHGLRPGSADEACVVAEAAHRFGVPFQTLQVTVGLGPNLEARARAARFAVLGEGVATGHTMDDQAETVLINLLRGCGLDGLAAMQPGPSHPILALRRSETRAICRALGLAWVEDPSNSDPRHLRNRVRHELLPLCARVTGRDPVPLLARAAHVAREDAAVLEKLSAQAVPDPADADRLEAVPAAVARRALRRWLRQQTTAGTGLAPPSAYPPSLAEVGRVLAVARGEAVATQLAGGHRLGRRHRRLFVELATTQAGSGKVAAVGTQQVASSAPAWASPEVGRPVVTADELATRVAALGAQITLDYADDPPLLVGVLKGAMVFMSDLCRAISLPAEVDFMAVASYGSSTTTSGVVRIVKDLDTEIEGRRVIVVEDIIDSGLTLNYLRKYLKARHPASLDVCALLVKAGVQRVDLDLRYVGFRIPSQFVVGYGLDVDERYRNLPGVHLYNGPAAGS